MEGNTRQPVKHLVDPATWVDEYGDYLLRYALSFVRDKQIAEDLVQETFLAALQSRSSFIGQSSEKTWLVGILKHKAVDYYRKTRRHTQFDANEDSDAQDGFVKTGRWAGFWQTGFEPTNWQFDPGRSAEQNAFQGILNGCLSRLSPRLATVFELRELEQRNTKEICAELNISESNLWVMLHRARQCLRRCIELKWLNRTKE
ncbi:MAG: sigma-70 family RNA polymerase sigma factor [Acidobacteriia bacterium]|nr:sigma-70 family RNA polymerase sigma factor [Terriglobia bacterium]